ncbi:beta-lactamase family protein [Micromonospora sp. STR1s_5]|nr:beta-lactamase family protein [Micromonospora sp. STR1s_5]
MTSSREDSRAQLISQGGSGLRSAGEGLGSEAAPGHERGHREVGEVQHDELHLAVAQVGDHRADHQQDPADGGHRHQRRLGQIVEKATGQSYGEEIKHRVVKPLRLRDTSVPGTSSRITGPHPHGYVRIRQNGESSLVDYTKMSPTVMGAGGEMISTTGDLNRFFAALLGGRLLPDHLLKEMKTPGVEGGRYGLGLAWWRDTSCGIRVYGNDGDALAYQSWSYLTDDRRRQVTIALTPDFSGDPDDAVDAFLNKALCG